MKKLTILTILTLLTGFTTALQTPQITIIEEPDVDLPGDYEPSEKPDVDPGFETNLAYSYESDLVNFNTSETIEADPEGLENISKPGSENETDNETTEQPEESPRNEKDEENSESSSYSSGSGDSDYSAPSIEVEVGEEDSTTNETNETEPSSSSSANNTQEPEERTQPGIFEGPWTETGGSSLSLQERLTGQFSESTTLGGITLLVFGSLAAYSYI